MADSAPQQLQVELGGRSRPRIAALRNLGHTLVLVDPLDTSRLITVPPLLLRHLAHRAIRIADLMSLALTLSRHAAPFIGLRAEPTAGLRLGSARPS